MRLFITIVVILLAVFLPNLIWLATSSLRIENTTALPIDSISYRACEKNNVIGILSERKSIFEFLEGCGDDTPEYM